MGSISSYQPKRFCRDQKEETAVSYTQTNGKKGTTCVYEVGIQHCKKSACFLEMKQWFAPRDRNKKKFH